MHQLSLSTDIFHPEIRYEIEKLPTKTLFCTVHISTNKLNDLKFCVVYVEGTVSQNFDLGLCCNLSKNG